MSDATVLYVMEDDVYEFETSGNLLNSAVDAGVPQEWSCRVGQCMACVGRVVDADVGDVLEYVEDGGDPGDVGDVFGYLEGDPDDVFEVVPNSSQTLTDEERGQGFVYTCVASPGRETDELVLDMSDDRYPFSI